MGSRLAASEVLVVDCQSTGSTPEHGHLIELGWARYACDTEPTELAAHVVALPSGAHLPPMVSRLTGLSPREIRDGVPREAAFRALDLAARAVRSHGASDATPTVIHFAQFEERFLRALYEAYDEPFPFSLDIVCTHAIARRLLPELPRRSLRALAGYFGWSSSQLRRSRDHVEATCFVWRNLVRKLEVEHDVCTWEELRGWLQRTRGPLAARRAYPMPKAKRLDLPDGPGVYRFHRKNGDLLYVGKATSLKKRVNSHFRKQAKLPERVLEMLTQARDLTFTATATPLEAALLESDEIKRNQPPYNVALLEEGRAVWFASRDLSSFDDAPSDLHPVGPLPSNHALSGFGTIHRLLAEPPGAAVSRWVMARALGIMPGSAPDEACFWAGLAEFRTAYFDAAPVPSPTLRALDRLARSIARRLEISPRERRDEETLVWDPARVREHLDEALARAPQLVARARWLCHLTDAAVDYTEPGGDVARRLTVCAAVVDVSGALEPRFERTAAERRRCFDIVAYDRLRVLTTEIKRIVRDGGRVEVSFGSAPLRGSPLARTLRGI